MEYSTLHNDDLVRVGTVLGTGIYEINEEAYNLRELKDQRARIMRSIQSRVWEQDHEADSN